MTPDLGTLVGLFIAAFVVFWAGFFTCALARAGKRADEQSGEVFEHWRGER